MSQPGHRVAIASSLGALACAVTFLASGITAAVQGAADPLSPAAAAVTRGDLMGAIAALRALFEQGYPTPAETLEDSRFAALREDPEARAAWRQVMKEAVRESRITMVTPEEAGTPMIIRGRVVRAPDGSPVAGARIELNHTDATGHYEPGRTAGGDGRARLFGFLVTDSEGRFEARTIKPAPYPGAGRDAAHVHYRASAEGYRNDNGAFRPYTNPADAEERATAVQRARRFTVVHEEDGELICEVTIPLVPLPSGE